MLQTTQMMSRRCSTGGHALPLIGILVVQTALQAAVAHPRDLEDKLEGLGAAYPNFSWRQRVRELELRVLLPPVSCRGWLRHTQIRSDRLI